MNNFIQREYGAILAVRIEKLEYLESCLEWTHNRIEDVLNDKALQLITEEKFKTKMSYLQGRVKTYERRMNEQDARIIEIENLLS